MKNLDVYSNSTNAKLAADGYYRDGRGSVLPEKYRGAPCGACRGTGYADGENGTISDRPCRHCGGTGERGMKDAVQEQSAMAMGVRQQEELRTQMGQDVEGQIQGTAGTEEPQEVATASRRRVQIEYTAEFVITRRTLDRDTGDVVAVDEVSRSSWFGEHNGTPIAAKGQAGWRCSHAVILSDDYEEPTCGWCESQGDRAEFTPCIAITCPNCYEGAVYLDDPTGGKLSFLRHLTHECGL